MQKKTKIILAGIGTLFLTVLYTAATLGGLLGIVFIFQEIHLIKIIITISIGLLASTSLIITILDQLIVNKNLNKLDHSLKTTLFATFIPATLMAILGIIVNLFFIIFFKRPIF